MNPETAVQAAAQALLMLAAGWVTGNFLLALALREKGRLPDSIGLPERGLAAVVGSVIFAVALMVGHIATRGGIFGTPWPVPNAAAGIIAFGVRRRMWPRSVPWGRVVAAAAVLFLIYLLPAAAGGSGARTGDSPWHFGFTNQLLSGETTPSGPAPEFGRNAYPWGFQAVLATMVRLIPGSNVLVAHEALHVLIVLTLPLSAACLARLVDRRAGWPAAAAASLMGGFGWILAGGPRFALSPSRASFGADLVVASPNSVYELFPPALPRELGLGLLATAGVLMAYAVRSPTRATAIATGVAVGVTGLVNLPLMMLAYLWLIAAALFDRRPFSRRSESGQLPWWLLAGATALATVGVWLIPVSVSYLRWGGFVDITPVLGIEWPLPTALGSWGLLLPIALTGATLVFRRRSEPGSKVVLAFVIATTAALALPLIRDQFEWSLGNNATLLHQGRVWPTAHLLGASLAGVALVAFFGRLRVRSRQIAVASIALVVAVASISPVLASIYLTRAIDRHRSGYVYSKGDLASDAFILRAASVLEARDIVRVQGSDPLGFFLFQFSGVRLASYDDPRLDANDLRIRYATLAAGWECRMAASGFIADYTALPEEDVPTHSRVVARGIFRDQVWVLVDGDPTSPFGRNVEQQSRDPSCTPQSSLTTDGR